MSGHVLLNLLNEFGNRNKMRGLPSNVLDFGNELKNIGERSGSVVEQKNNTGAQCLFLFIIIL